jgi:hypothetical protein
MPTEYDPVPVAGFAEKDSPSPFSDAGPLGAFRVCELRGAGLSARATPAASHVTVRSPA